MSAKAHVIHTGCRLNQYESSALAAGLGEKGLSVSESVSDSDYIVINTCTVTNKADGRNRSHIRKIHRLNPSAKIIVTGCYATTDAQEIKKMPGVYWVVPNVKKALIPSMLSGTLQQEHKPNEGLFGYSFRMAEGQARAHLKIQDGCNKSCSYCKIPHARGEAQSRSFQDSVSEAKHLIQSGFHEISLTGVNIGWYKTADGHTFYDLVNEILSLDGDFMVRISSIEPADVNKHFSTLFQSEKMAKFAHVPLQSGSRPILKRMRRGYTPEKFRENIQQLRAEVPDIHIGTDIITGFPSETNQNFEETLKFMQELEFANTHVFPFSKRKNTPIVKLLEMMNFSESNHRHFSEVHGSVVNERVNILMELARDLSEKYIQKTAGKVFRAIAEKVTPENTRFTTENYVKCSAGPLTISGKRGDMFAVTYDKDSVITEVNRLKTSVAL